MRTALGVAATLLVLSVIPSAQAPPVTVLRPARVFDGDAMHEGWAVRVRGDRIDAVGGEAAVAAAGARVIELPGATLTPGLVEGHSHILLHAYTETSWTDQVSREGLALRVARATNHLRSTLMAGFTVVRDLGTEGAGYADVELKQAVDQGIIPGPHILASTRAIVATGSYQPKFVPEWHVPQGAEEADGVDGLIRVVRDQIGKGADWIKLYADYRWSTSLEARPTFSVDELKLAVETAKSAGIPVAVHATTAEGMRRAALAGVETIEHGNEGTLEVFKLMAERHVALCPTLTAASAVWPPVGPETQAQRRRRESFKAALDAGRDDPQRQRLGHFSSRRKRAGARSHGRLRDDTGRRAQERDVRRCTGAAHGESNRSGESRPARRPRRIRRRSVQRHLRAASCEVRDEERRDLQTTVASGFSRTSDVDVADVEVTEIEMCTIAEW